MRNRLLIGFAALLVCATNALAQHQQVTSRFACSDFDCDNDAGCKNIGCGKCSSTPKLQKRCTAG